MTTINTVLGTCEPKELGFTLIHEHLMAGMPGWEFDNTGFDRFGIETIASDKMRLASLIGLLAVGYDRIMLSHDAVHCWLGRVTKEIREFMVKCPNWYYAHICKNILPTLQKAGVSEGAIRTLTVDNPRNYFGG